MYRGVAKPDTTEKLLLLLLLFEKPSTKKGTRCCPAAAASASAVTLLRLFCFARKFKLGLFTKISSFRFTGELDTAAVYWPAAEREDLENPEEKEG